jgi:hypothetical protein
MNVHGKKKIFKYDNRRSHYPPGCPGPAGERPGFVS